MTTTRRRRLEIERDLEYTIKELTNLLESSKAGERLYASVFHGSTMQGLPSKIAVLRAFEDLEE